MAELIPSEDWKAKHRLNPDVYFSDIYSLLSCVLASPSIAQFREESKGRWFDLGWQQSEISRLLIHIASYYRVKYDDGSWMHARWLHKEFNGVGTLVEDISEPTKSQLLDFREACNKVIHAKKLHFDGEVDVQSSAGILNPVIYLYGDRGERHWKATINLVEFCRAAINVIV